DLAHDDEVDACSGALEMLNPEMKGWAYYEYMRRAAQAIEEQRKPQPRPDQTAFAPGSMEWQAEQNKPRWTVAAARRVAGACAGLRSRNHFTRLPGSASSPASSSRSSSNSGRGTDSSNPSPSSGEM